MLESADMPVMYGSNLACERRTSHGGSGAAITSRWSSKLVFLNPDGDIQGRSNPTARRSGPDSTDSRWHDRHHRRFTVGGARISSYRT